MEILTFITDYIIGFFLLISILVFVHEFGHYIFAKLFKVKVEAFSIGFGKEIFGWTDKSGTRWKICPIPFGGYVKMKGEMIESNNPNSISDPDSFQEKPLFAKFLIVFAGPLFNLIFPVIILLFIAFFVGVPSFSSKVNEVVIDSPAYNILQKDDIIIKAQNNEVSTFKDLQEIISMIPDELVDLTIKRNNNVINLQIKTGSREVEGGKVGYLGITADQSTENTSQYSPLQSIKYTYQTYTRVFSLITQGFGKLFSGDINSDDIGGPIKIAQISGDALNQGLPTWLFFMAMLSINLAIINLFPFPALDGGFLLLYIIQGITRRKLNVKIQSFIIQIGFIFLISLMVLIVFKDIFSFL